MIGANFTHIRQLLPASTWVFTFFLLGTAAALQGFSDVTVLRYQSDWYVAGEYWRLLSGHIVHLGWMHWLLNAVGFLLILVLLPRFSRPLKLLSSGLLSALYISLMFHWLEPQLNWYVGLSGVLHGWMALGAGYEILRKGHERLMAAMILILVIGKVTYEMHFGDVVTGELIGGEVVYVAHVYGVLSGILMSAMLAIRYYLRPVLGYWWNAAHKKRSA